jgi:hypothetical protein
LEGNTYQYKFRGLEPMTITLKYKKVKVEVLENCNALYVTIKDKVFYIDYSIDGDEPSIETSNIWDEE